MMSETYANPFSSPTAPPPASSSSLTPITSAPPPAGAAAAKASSSFSFPREYHFPPFFTRQLVASTFHAQCNKWSALIQAYCRFHRLWKLTLADAVSSDLFANPRIAKALRLADAREVLEFMRREGRAEWVVGGGGGGGVGEERSTAWIWWRTPEEWAAAIADWVSCNLS